jgi:hypothetical protein
MPNLTDVADQANKILAGTDFWAKEEFLLTTPVSPPHGQTSAVRKKAAPIKFDYKSGYDAAQMPLVKAKVDSVIDKIGFIKFRPVRSNTDGQEGAITFDVKFAHELKQNADRVGYVPCWFLPWKSAHLVSFKINPINDSSPQFKPGNGVDPLPNPELFFTAAINGCSVFAYGDPLNPTLHHCGIGNKFDEVLEDEQFRGMGGDSAKIWYELLEGIATDDKGNLVLNSRSKDKSKLKASRPNFSQANRYDYISRKTSSGKIELITDESERFENFLQTKRRDTLTGVMVNPWGCVFGLRSSAGNWTFTLQRNATVLYKQKTSKKGKINSVNCTTLGDTKFFPGKNEIHYRAIESIQVY